MAKMLLVEDDRMVRKLLRDVLANEGHNVVSTETYEAGSRLLHQGNIELLIADVLLPDGSGETLAHEAQAIGIPELIITGHGDVMHRLGKKGVYFLAKPFRPTDLLEAVERRLGMQHV